MPVGKLTGILFLPNLIIISKGGICVIELITESATTPKVTRVIVNQIYPIVEKSMGRNQSAYKKNIQDFIKARSADLYDTVPIRRIPFGSDDIDSYFKSLKINKADITAALSNTYYWNMNFNPRAAKDEFTVCQMMVIRYYVMKSRMTDAELASIYLAFSGKFYPSIHSQKFKIPPEKYRHIMEYVLNNVMTMKYDLKREGSVFGAVRSICKTWLNTYRSKFKNPDDEDIADMIQQLHGRIKSFLGNIASAYYSTYEKRDVYFTYASDSNEQDTYRIADSDSLLAERCVENAMNYITSHQVDYKLCRYSHDSNVSTDEIKSIIESIQEDRDNLILLREFMQLMVVDYFENSKEKDVTSYEFVTKSIVPKPNSKNKAVVRQKEIVEEFLNENSPGYRKRKSRAATKSSYNKAITTYYALVINQSNK